MLTCKDVSYSYIKKQSGGQSPHHKEFSLKNINLKIERGSFVVFCGESGCGKTSLTRLFNGLIPHYFEGDLQGQVTIDGKEVKNMSLFDLSSLAGSVFQNPRSQFFNVDTTSELGFACENHGLPEEDIISRVRQISKKLKLDDLLGRSLFNLSGGQKQKIACGSAMAMDPGILILDEPSSNLDPSAIEDLAKILRSFKEEGKTILIAEHRLYYLYDIADRIIYLKDGQISGDYRKEEFGKISQKEKRAMGLRPTDLTSLLEIEQPRHRVKKDIYKIQDLRFSFNNDKKALDIDKIETPKGSITSIIGNNGSGKTSLLRAICGLEKKAKGVLLDGENSYGPKERLKLSYLVMQDVNHQIFTESVHEEINISLENGDPSRIDQILDQMNLTPYGQRHSMSLSGGQKQRVAIGSALASQRPIILFDEPTSGLDLFNMERVAKSLKQLVDQGKTIILTSHDPEFIFRTSDHVVHLDQGQVISQYSMTNDKDRKDLIKFFDKGR